mgnify:CR=1 FL=1
MYLLLSGASLYFHGGFLVGPLSWCLEASVFFLPAFKPIPQTRGIGFFIRLSLCKIRWRDICQEEQVKIEIDVFLSV